MRVFYDAAKDKEDRLQEWRGHRAVDYFGQIQVVKKKDKKQDMWLTLMLWDERGLLPPVMLVYGSGNTWYQGGARTGIYDAKEFQSSLDWIIGSGNTQRTYNIFFSVSE